MIPISLRRCSGILTVFPLRTRPECLEFSGEQSRSSAARRFSGYSCRVMTYFIFRMSQVCDCHSGEPYSLRCPSISPSSLSLNGLTQAAERMLDVSRGVTLSTWLRPGAFELFNPGDS